MPPPPIVGFVPTCHIFIYIYIHVYAPPPSPLRRPTPTQVTSSSSMLTPNQAEALRLIQDNHDAYMEGRIEGGVHHVVLDELVDNVAEMLFGKDRALTEEVRGEVDHAPIVCRAFFAIAQRALSCS